MKVYRLLGFLLFSGIIFSFSCKKSTVYQPGILQVKLVKAGNTILNSQTTTKNISIDSAFLIEFNNPIDTISARKNILLKKTDDSTINCIYTYFNDLRSVRLQPVKPLVKLTQYHLLINSELKGAYGGYFTGTQYSFTTVIGTFQISSITLNGQNFNTSQPLKNVSFSSLNIAIQFDQPLDPRNYQTYFNLYPQVSHTISISGNNTKVNITGSTALNYYYHYYLNISKELKAQNGFSFIGFSNSFYTALDSTSKFPLISDDELLRLIMQKTFAYFYDFAHPDCGMARERNNSGDIVTMGGSGFGVMALIAGMSEGFITRDQGVTRLSKILGFLETCDRFHGAWPHWLNGSTGKVIAFTIQDDGADLVETSYMIEGLMTMRQYLDPNVSKEKDLIDRIDLLTDAVEYDWFTRGQNVLYWHWSPDYNWAMNMKIEGYNETLITYIVASTSTTHPISADVYHKGYAKNGAIRNGNSYYGIKLPLGEPYGGPLFFTHYSFLGLDPRKLQDVYANYWEQNVNQSLINREYCITNPHNYIAYSNACWGLTASDNPWGYSAHSPTNDLGTITPTAAISAIPYIPDQSMAAIKHFYYILGDRLWGTYGFYDAFDVDEGWWADSYLAIDQGPIICMIENYRTKLLWNLFMSHPKVADGLTKLGFTY